LLDRERHSPLPYSSARSRLVEALPPRSLASDKPFSGGHSPGLLFSHHATSWDAPTSFRPTNSTTKGFLSLEFVSCRYSARFLGSVFSSSRGHITARTTTTPRVGNVVCSFERPTHVRPNFSLRVYWVDFPPDPPHTPRTHRPQLDPIRMCIRWSLPGCSRIPLFSNIPFPLLDTMKSYRPLQPRKWERMSGLVPEPSRRDLSGDSTYSEPPTDQILVGSLSVTTQEGCNPRHCIINYEQDPCFGTHRFIRLYC